MQLDPAALGESVQEFSRRLRLGVTIAGLPAFGCASLCSLCLRARAACSRKAPRALISLIKDSLTILGSILWKRTFHFME